MIDTSGRQEYLTRRFSRLVAICGLCLGAIWSFDLLVRPMHPAWWSICGYILVLATLALLAVRADVMRLRALRTFMWVSTLLGLALQLLTFPATRGPISPVVWEISWTLTGIYLCFIALLLETNRPHLAINLIAAVVALFPALSFWATYGYWPLHFWVVTLVQFTNVGFPMMLNELRSRLTTFGARQDRWRRRVTESAAMREELREERRLEGVLHDHILGVMSQIIWSNGEITNDLRTSLRAALALIRSGERPGEDRISVQEIRTIVETALRDTDTDIAYSVTATGGALPENVVATVMAALMEAVRNSAKHAPGSHRTVRAEFSDTSVRVVVLDDGPGFVVESVPTDRLGVSRSISGRMRDLPGGSSQIKSTPGAGTVVILEWSRQ